MSENLQDIPPLSQNQETQQDTLGILLKQSQEVQDIVQNNPRISQHLDEITNLEEFLKNLEVNKGIFTQSDNHIAQEKFLEQSLKGLGYGQMTQDGRKYENLSEEDVDGLSDTEYDKYQKWKIIQKKQAAITRTGEEGKIDQAAIENQRDIDAGKEILKIKSNLSSSANDSIERKFQQAKSNPNNPLALDLRAKGIEPQSAQYDSLLRASIILSNIDELRKEAKNQTEFDVSIGELNKLEIPRDISLKIDAINAHIDARFPKDESTERARAEITRSLEGGSVANIYYDGRGEKYTLVDKDGTSKEVYMNPPKVKVYRENLSISADLPDQSNHIKKLETEKEGKKVFTINQEKIGNFFDAVKNRTTKEEAAMINGTNKEQIQKYFATLSGPSTIETKENAVKELRSIYSQTRNKVDLNIESVLSQDFTANISPKDVFDNRLFQLREIETGIEREKEVRDKYRAIPQDTTNMSGFDDTAKSNLSLLTDMKFHKIGPRAQEALDRVITETNRGRDEKNKIKLNEKSLDESDQRALKTALEKLGGKPGVFESESRLRTFRLDVEKALALPSDHPLSLESQINGTYERTYNNG